MLSLILPVQTLCGNADRHEERQAGLIGRRAVLNGRLLFSHLPLVRHTHVLHLRAQRDRGTALHGRQGHAAAAVLPRQHDHQLGHVRSPQAPRVPARPAEYRGDRQVNVSAPECGAPKPVGREVQAHLLHYGLCTDVQHPRIGIGRCAQPGRSPSHQRK
jgi:hypothetical protein